MLAALRAGDEHAFRVLVERHYPMMRRMARGYVQTDAVAEEVVQDTWLAVVTGIERFEGRSSLTTWLFSILTNKAKTRGTRERRTLPFSCLGGGNDERARRGCRPLPGRRRRVARALGNSAPAVAEAGASPPLTRGARAPEGGARRAAGAPAPVVTLRDVEGLRSEEVCDLLDISAENQRVLLHRGRSRLRADARGRTSSTDV